MTIVLDMNLPPSWVEFLSRHGIEAVHWTDVGDIRASDADIMRWAVENEHVVFTHDLDFSTLLAVTGSEAGVRKAGGRSRFTNLDVLVF